MAGRVDAHQHVWRLARGDYGWLTPALASIYRDFGLSDAHPLAAAAGIDTVVLVQAAPTVAETRFLLDTAKGSDGFVRGVVGWTDLAAPDAERTLEELAGDPLLKGIRPMLHDLPDPAWILRADVQPALAALPSLGLTFDALVKPRELPALRQMLDRHPDLAVVVDHGAKPPIAAGGLAAVGRRPRRDRAISERPLQAVGAGDRGQCRLAHPRSRALRRSPARLLRTRAADLGQRLAGSRTGRRLRALDCCRRRVAARAGATRDRSDPQWQCAAFLPAVEAPSAHARHLVVTFVQTAIQPGGDKQRPGSVAAIQTVRRTTMRHLAFLRALFAAAALIVPSLAAAQGELVVYCTVQENGAGRWSRRSRRRPGSRF
jgi:hypothetical protein